MYGELSLEFEIIIRPLLQLFLEPCIRPNQRPLPAEVGKCLKIANPELAHEESDDQRGTARHPEGTVHQNPLSPLQRLPYKGTRLLEVLLHVFLRRIFDLQVQVVEILREVRSELISGHHDALYAELFEEVEIGGAFAVSNVEIFGDLVGVCCEDGVFCRRKALFLRNQHALIYISIPVIIA